MLEILGEQFLIAYVKVPLLAFAGACDHQFTPDAVKRTAYHLAALDDQQVIS